AHRPLRPRRSRPRLPRRGHDPPRKTQPACLPGRHAPLLRRPLRRRDRPRPPNQPDHRQVRMELRPRLAPARNGGKAMSAPASKVGPYTPLELFEGATRLPPSERAAYLDARCDDASLRAEVESLLLHHDAAGEFLEHSPFAPEKPASDSATLGE